MKFLTSIATMALALTSTLTGTLAAPAPDPSTHAASTTGSCTSTTDRCSGDITYYDGGLGACGWSVDTNTQNVVSLPHAFMGTLSNSNPLCGKSITLFNPATGKTATGVVGDKCMGCVDRSVDLTRHLFGELTNGAFDLGRVHGVQWWFN